MTKLVIIDGNAILHRAFHALPISLTTKQGQPINAVYGFVSMLLKITQDLKPTHIAICFDTPKPTFRHTQYVGYQAHRPRMDSGLSSQFEIAYKILEAMNIPIYRLEGYEADDVIGTICFQAAHHTDEIVVVTGDRDILQLVDDKVKVYMPIKGLSNAKLFGDDEVIERMKVKPSQIVDYKALAGDSSDNYPGVPGIGPKGAISVLEKYENLENIYKHLDEIPQNLSKKLALGAESAGMSKKLATIVKDVPVTFHLGESSKWDLSSNKVLEAFAEIGFKTLAKRVQQMSLI